jgi:hypothetical protein
MTQRYTNHSTPPAHLTSKKTDDDRRLSISSEIGALKNLIDARERFDFTSFPF